MQLITIKLLQAGGSQEFFAEQSGKAERSKLFKLSSKQKVVFKTKINCLIIMNLFDKIKEKAWQAIKRKAVEVIVAILTAAITALTTTSCMGHGPF